MSNKIINNLHRSKEIGHNYYFSQTVREQSNNLK